MNNSIWIYPWDIQDEGIENVLDRIQKNGIKTLNVVTNYHSGHFFLPHNPKRKEFFPEPGALYFIPGDWYDRSKIKPRISRFANSSFWTQLREETRKRGMKITAWSLALHSSAIGINHPQACVENAFGDLLPTCLAAENRDVKEFLMNLYSDLSTNFDFDNILIESLEYMPFRHGYQHEVIGIPVGATAEFFMTLSFTRDMYDLASKEGIDLDKVRQYVCDYCEKAFADPGSQKELSWDEIKAAAEGEMGKYLLLRENILTELYSDIGAVIKANGHTKFSSLDFGPLYGMGPDSVSWQNGVDLSKIVPLIDEIHPTFYFTDVNVIKKKYLEYESMIEKLGQKIDVVPAIRAVLPQIQEQKDIGECLDAFDDRVSGFSFYNYGFMLYETLSTIGKELERRKLNE